MIRSESQAMAVQERRFKAGKKGTSKSVRRYFIRKFEGNTGRAYAYSGPLLASISNFEGCRTFDEVYFQRNSQ